MGGLSLVAACEGTALTAERAAGATVESNARPLRQAMTG